ncbi:hypothetical protein F751_1268 [Auxenochlorella protothecoides]|uniref:Uncharacterized protein n=1 Tax=Auxenochlorella protothecoides TaxID=3075 RepID=A0A087SMZ1_AUXPR|nr:hypothetical protein F751_1268 [Auxenochlorella protothecoides]KFM27095.1 hypothetical protein F751_1268 [Auxenochlorella protothecoides]
MCDLSSCIAQKEARLGTEGLGGDSPALEQVEGLPLSLLSLKTRPIGWDAWHFLSSRRNILITLIRNEGVSTLLVLNAYFAHLYEEEERADRECTRAVLDLAAVRRLPPALSSRLTEEELGAGSGRSAAATPGAQPAAEAEEADELAALVSAAAVCNVMLANDGFVGQAPSLG